MSNALKHFAITFVACLLIFGLIAWQWVMPALSSAFGLDGENGPEESTSSGTVEPPPPVIVDPEEGRTFTAVMIGLAADGNAASVIYMRSNEGTKRFSYSFIPPNTKAANSVGVETPLKLLLPGASEAEILNKMSSLTGVPIQYYITIGQEQLAAIAEKLSNAQLDLTQEIRYIDPQYKQVVDSLPQGSVIPEEYYVKIPQGRNKITPELVNKIYGYNPNHDGSEYHTLVKQLHEAVFAQFMTDAGTKSNLPVLSSLLNTMTTNITAGVLNDNIDLIFTFDSLEYKRESVSYSSSRGAVITAFRRADGR